MTRSTDRELRVAWNWPTWMRHSRAPEMAFELLRLRRALRNVVTMAHHQHPSPNCGFDNIRGIARAALAPEKAKGRKK